MGQWLSRIHTGSDSFFTGLDGKLGRLEEQRGILEARKEHQERLWFKIKARFLALFLSIYICILAYAVWVIQQPQGTFTNSQHAVRISLVFVSPALAYLWYQAMSVVFKAFIKHTDARIRRCHAKTEKILHGLKDTMRYDRTHALLSKYDPDYNANSGMQYQVHDMKRGAEMIKPNRGEVDPRTERNNRMSLPRKMTAVAASTMGGAGMRLSGALAQLWSVTADTVIGDDPVLLNSLRVAESQAQALEHENVELKKKIERYEEQFGLLYDVSLEATDGSGDSRSSSPPPPVLQKSKQQKEEEDMIEEDTKKVASLEAERKGDVAQKSVAKDVMPRRRTRQSQRLLHSD